MSSNGAWVAASTRAVGLAKRRLGRSGALDVAAAPTLPLGLRLLGSPPYGRIVEPGMDLRAAVHAVDATALWHLRVLAGWTPPLGAAVLKVLAGRFELENLVALSRRLAGGEPEQAFVLGSLATSWRLAAVAHNVGELRRLLASGPWGDPGDDDPAVVRLGLELAWACQLLRAAPEQPAWASAYGAVTMAKVVSAGGERLLAEDPRRDAMLLVGDDAVRAAGLPELRDRLPLRCRFVLDGVNEATDLWLAEKAWWERVEQEAEGHVIEPLPGPSSVLAVGMLLLCDARRVRGALELAALGGRGAHEASDVLA